MPRLPIVLSTALGISLLGIALSGGATVQAGTAAARPPLYGGGFKETAKTVAPPRHSGSLSAPGLRTIADVRGRIGAFAQDANRIAWIQRAARCDQLVQVRTLSTGVQRGLVSNHGTTCGNRPYDLYVPSLALAGKRALWALVWGFGQEETIELVTGVLGERHDVSVGDLSACCGREGRSALETSIPMAGDRATLVFVDADDGIHGTPDRGVRRVDGRRSMRVPGLIGAFAIAVSGGRIAILSDINRTNSFVCACDGEASWSPSGDRIAFSSQPEGDRRFSAIEIVGADGTSARKITNQTLGEYKADSQPDWSPDGSRLTFVRTDASSSFYRHAIWTMNADGTHQRQLTKGIHPAWSPDGTKIAFVNENSIGATTGISVVNAEGSGGRRITTDGEAFEPDWSPDGTNIVFTKGGDLRAAEIRVISADGGDSHRVGSGYSPAWSPDGTRIAFVRFRGVDLALVAEIRVMNVDGGSDHPVADGWDPSWAPDSTRLAITKQVDRDTNIVLVGADGSTETRLTTAKFAPIAPTLQLREARTGRQVARRIIYGGRGQEVALSPSYAAVLASEEGGKHIAIYHARDGSAVGSVAVQPTAGSLSISGRRIVFRSGRKIWLLDATTRRVSLLTTAAAKPIGLSIEGRRVAWAENLHSRGRVRALNVRCSAACPPRR